MTIQTLEEEEDDDRICSRRVWLLLEPVDGLKQALCYEKKWGKGTKRYDFDFFFNLPSGVFASRTLAMPLQSGKHAVNLSHK